MVVPLSARSPSGDEPVEVEKGTALSSLPDIKWSPKYYLTYRGAENYIVMVWLLKGKCAQIAEQDVRVRRTAVVQLRSFVRT